MKKETTLKDAINELLRLYGLEEKMQGITLIKVWEDVMGRVIAKHTTDIFYKKKVLTVKIDSAPLRQELHYMQTEIIQKLNESMGKELVSELKLL
jgi:predicted nucleic acid-binding Zn ribbon protein